MLVHLESVRAQTLNNNIAWLESFGCQVSSEDGLISIEHPEIPGYSIRLLAGPSEMALKQLQNILNDSERRKDAPDIFIDEAVSSPAISSALTSKGFIVTAVNITKYSNWASVHAETAVTLRPASPEDFDQWTDLYSEGFGRYGREAEYDRYRWRKSFKAQNIRHWFLVMEKDRIGVCQTCLGNGVTGIYSFTLRSTKKGMRYLRPAIRALQSKLTENGGVTVYFERLRNRDWLNKQLVAADPYGFKVIRIMIGFHR